MTCSKNEFLGIYLLFLIDNNTCNFIVIQKNVGEFRIEPNFATTSYDLLSNSRNDLWKFIRSDMWVIVDQNVIIRTKLNECAENAVYVSPFGGTRIKFSV